MERAYHKWHSPALQRDMELLVFGHAGRAVVFFPTRMARFYDYENWGIIGSLFEKIEAGQLQLFCVDSVDAESFYNKSISPALRIQRHLQYESYIINEVIPFIKVCNADGCIEAAGCSMGAYHALNIAFRHSTIFKRVVSMSGRYDLTVQLPDYNDLFDGYHDDDIYFNMPQQYIANLTDSYLLNNLSLMDITLVIGNDDPFCPGNQQFNQLLWYKNIPHHFFIWEGNAHKPKYWREMVKLYL
ncbi:esterase family protein [Mucilaginibacter aquatilis]|uniref:Esterase n=1 Tax=Mucilaginibacter aquatilis TaxID=1517760 RepID=A0A6I4IBA2_9SPHI|nr:alpha/beta hydrolase-fold protein [Mucilaginibacter aquatilis]MVN92475.1 esterase [Mucilaginibacter aquatilis]